MLCVNDELSAGSFFSLFSAYPLFSGKNESQVAE